MTQNRQPPTAKRLYHICTFGCKVNQVDSAGLAQELAGRGWDAAPPGAVPDLILVNTCTVTARADQQARQTIRRLAREYPGAALWVTGCYAQRAPGEVAALPGVQAVLGNQEKARLAQILAEHSRPGTGAAAPSPLMGGGTEMIPANPARSLEGSGSRPKGWVGSFAGDPPFHPWPVRLFPGHTRAWLKIQEGCDHRCTYCIVPQVRGPRRSMAPDGVVASLQELAALAYQEVVLTGVDLGQYGQDLGPPQDLAGLVRRLQEQDWPFRVRLSSLEPQEVTGELLRELAAWPRFCPHFHLPLQSGAAPVLAAMGRPYTPGDFTELVRDLHRRFPEAGLGLDVLVGFPGESAADFEATRALVAQLPVTYLHVFPFSPRPGTPAARLTPLPGREIRARAEIMRDLGRRKKLQFLKSQLGRIREVLVEGPAPRPGWLKGLSDNYLRVILPGPPTLRNRRLLVRGRRLRGETLEGEVVGGSD